MGQLLQCVQLNQNSGWAIAY